MCVLNFGKDCAIFTGNPITVLALSSMGRGKKNILSGFYKTQTKIKIYLEILQCSVAKKSSLVWQMLNPIIL